MCEDESDYKLKRLGQQEASGPLKYQVVCCEQQRKSEIDSSLDVAHREFDTGSFIIMSYKSCKAALFPTEIRRFSQHFQLAYRPFKLLPQQRKKLHRLIKNSFVV